MWMSSLRSAQIPCARSCVLWNFVLWCLRFVGLQWGTSFTSPFWHLDFDVVYKFLENCQPQVSFTSRNGILRFEENLTHQGFVCVRVCVRCQSSVHCAYCSLFFRWAVFLYLAYISVGWPNSSQLYSYFFCCMLYLFNMSTFSESDEVLPLGVVCKQWLKMLIV